MGFGRLTGPSSPRARAQTPRTLFRPCFYLVCYLCLGYNNNDKKREQFQQQAWAVFCAAVLWGFVARRGQPRWVSRVRVCAHECDLLACAMPHVFKITVPISC